ncbi:hypothetical protein SAMN05216267_101596 [Actinacidiphila rubida]|uniref:Uncharacterized protein n=1 Tax=Actinacidiphila rubida TaxID=310780 RepID=A0A1H8L8H7_9ACTN|nr:hypothetical protein SAMN05216267_101596 [Actinacidiphila rubida]
MVLNDARPMTPAEYRRLLRLLFGPRKGQAQ